MFFLRRLARKISEALTIIHYSVNKLASIGILNIRTSPMQRILTVILITLPFFLTAQDITVSEEIGLTNIIDYDILGEMGNHILFFQDSKTEIKVKAFNPQLRLSWEKELILDKRAPQVLGVLPDKQSFSVLYSYRQRGNTLIKLHRYDPAANLMDSSLVVNLGYLFFTPNFQVIRSEDRSKILLFYPENSDIIRSYAIDVVNQKLLWEQSFEPNDFMFSRDFVQAVITNDAEMTYILERDNHRSKRKQHYYEVHTYDGKGEIPISKNIVMGDYLTYDVYFEVDNMNKQIIAAGLFSVDNPERAKGFFYLRYKPGSTDSALVNFTPFEESFLENLLTRDYRLGRGLSDASVRETVLRRDGGALLVVERIRQLNRRTGDLASRGVYFDNTGRTLIDHYFEDVFILSIHPDGELHWETILHKKQYSQDDGGVFSSYFLFETPGRLRFLFNDEIRFENTVSEYVINGRGEYDRNSLFSTANLELRLRFAAAVQLSSHSLVVPSERRNKLKLVRIDY